jgi:hypothetical protein
MEICDTVSETRIVAKSLRFPEDLDNTGDTTEDTGTSWIISLTSSTNITNDRADDHPQVQQTTSQKQLTTLASSYCMINQRFAVACWQIYKNIFLSINKRSNSIHLKAI